MWTIGDVEGPESTLKYFMMSQSFLRLAFADLFLIIQSYTSTSALSYNLVMLLQLKESVSRTKLLSQGLCHCSIKA